MADTAKQITDRLRRSAEVLTEADIPADLRGAAFVLAYRDLAQSGADSSDEGASRPTTPQVAKRSAADPLERIAQRLHLDSATVERFVDADDDGVHLLVQRRWLSQAKRSAMKQLTLLLLAVRQAAQLEEWTLWTQLREASDEFGIYDSKHFSEEIRSITGLRVRGEGASREVKATIATFEEAGELARHLVPDSSA